MADSGPVGQLIPEHFDLSSIEPSEQRVVNALIAGTDPGWLVLPHIPFREAGTDGEADIVVLHPDHGAVVIEVKGGRIGVREGTWQQDGRALRRSPVDQAVSAKHALLNKVREVCDEAGTGTLWFGHAVAFPDAPEVPSAWLGPALEPQMVLTKPELEWPSEALARLIPERRTPASAATMHAVLRALRPSLEFAGGLGPELVVTGRRLDESTENMLKTAEAADANRRLRVEGPAGSGKSRLAIRWARRAAARGERVLLVCFNVPMAAIFSMQFADEPGVTAGSFHDIALRLLAATAYEPGETRDKRFFDEEVATALFSYRDDIDAAFDTIIVDEAQDFQTDWLVSIEALLDPAGSQRLYLLGDRRQNIYQAPEAPSDGAFVLPLGTNCRNTKAIAEIGLRLGGGPTFDQCPQGPPVEFIPVRGEKEYRKRLARQLTALRTKHRVAPSDIAVITTSAELRDKVLDGSISAAKLVRWDARDESSVVCETAHRLKGTEWQAVIVVSDTPLDREWLPDILYVAVTRATTWLSVIATDEIGELLGLVEPAPSNAPSASE